MGERSELMIREIYGGEVVIQVLMSDPYNTFCLDLDGLL